jgi:drug/metabolite transporter (DMT)-like permease
VYWISLLLRRTTFTRRMGLASAVAFAGAVVVDMSTGQVASQPAHFGLGVFLGDVLLLSAALSWSLFVVLSQPLVKELGAVQTLTSVFLIGTLWQIPLVAADALWFDLSTFQLSSVTWRGWAGFAFITLVTAYLNYLLWYLVTARYDVTRSSVVTNTHFLITVIIEAAWFQQRLNGWVAVGSALLLLGIVLATFKPDAGREAMARGQRG